MNTYQRVISCVFRVTGIIVISYALVTLLTLIIMTGRFLPLLTALPGLLVGLAFLFGALPLARLATQGISED